MRSPSAPPTATGETAFEARLASDIVGETTVCVAARSRAPFASAMFDRITTNQTSFFPTLSGVGIQAAGGVTASLADSIYVYGESFDQDQYFIAERARLGLAVDRGPVTAAALVGGSIATKLTSGAIFGVALTGASGGVVEKVADCTICIPSKETPRIQECHILTGHVICEIVERIMCEQGEVEAPESALSLEPVNSARRSHQE